jgi:uncharacterized protein (DUF433 family)
VLIMLEMQDSAFTTEQVLKLTGVPRRRLGYWLDRGVVTADIDVARGRGHVRLWSYRNLIEIRIASWLREHVSLQLIGAIVRKLRQRGLDAPLAEVRVGVLARSGRRPGRIVVQDADGTWEEPLTGQLVMTLAIPVDAIDRDLRRAVERERRAARQPGRIERRRGRLGSTPVFAGTRVPVAAVRRLHEAGWSVQRILEAYPGLTSADVRAVLPDKSKRAG